MFQNVDVFDLIGMAGVILYLGSCAVLQSGLIRGNDDTSRTRAPRRH